MYFKNEWGTVCRNGWSNQDAKVICRQLGYPEGNHQAVYDGFRRGTGRICLDDVNCTGTENNITECSHNGWANHSCVHSEDAGVVCLPGKFMHTIEYIPLFSCQHQWVSSVGHHCFSSFII